MKHIGLLTCRNEVDIIESGLAGHARYFDTIVAIDGSDDGSREVIECCPEVVKCFHDEDILAPGERFSDGHRSVALQWIIEHYGFRDVWVTLLHPDEFWEDDPVLMAEFAADDAATFVLWAEFRFFLPTELQFWWRDAPAQFLSLTAEKRLMYYAGPFFERRQFSLKTHRHYIVGRDHDTLPAPVTVPHMRWHHIPRFRHYPFRSPDQIQKRASERGRRMIQPDHDPFVEQPFVRALPQPSNSPLAAWDNVGIYDGPGSLPNPASFLPAWWRG